MIQNPKLRKEVQHTDSTAKFEGNTRTAPSSGVPDWRNNKKLKNET